MADGAWTAALAAGDALNALRDALFVAAEARVRLAAHTQRTGAAVAELDRALSRIDIAAARAATFVDAAGDVRGGDAATHAAADALQDEWDAVSAEMERVYIHISDAKMSMVVRDVEAQCRAALDALDAALTDALAGSADALTRARTHAAACTRMLEILGTSAAAAECGAQLEVLSARLRLAERLAAPHTPPAHFHPGAATPRSTRERMHRRSSMLPRPSDTPRTPRTPTTPTSPHAAPTSPARRRLARADTHAPPLPGALRGVYVPDARDALDVAVARICNARRVHVVRLDARDAYARYELAGKTVACRLLHIHRTPDPLAVDTRHVHVRVGGGWLELEQWLDARPRPAAPP